MKTNKNIIAEEIKELKKLNGEVKGVPFITDLEYVRSKKGEEGLKALEKETEKLGWPIRYKEIQSTKWYPIGLRVVSLLACQKVFGWEEKEIFEMGNAAPKRSLIIRILMKYLVSLKKVCEKAPEFWSKHFAFGSCEVPDYNEKEKYIIVHLKDCKIHPLYCIYLAGYILRLFQFVIKGKAKIEETKCMFRGDPHHEYKIIWE